MTEITQIDPRAEGQFDTWFEVLRVTDEERWPDKPGWQHNERLAWALDDDGPEHHRCLLARGDDGRVLGIGDLETYRRENQHLARLDVRVLPDERRRGVGTAIIERATAMALGEGRTELGGMDESPARAGFVDLAGPFARRLGFAPAQQMARRELVLPLPEAQMQALRNDPRARPDGYTLVQFGDRWPDQYLDDRCELGRRMSTDAPMGEQELDEEDWDATRVRAIESMLAAQNRGKVTTAARHDASGHLVAFTDVAVPLGAPESSWQHDTLVMREHRGHGLGFAVKVANIDAVLAAYPAVRCINTWNAVENVHMIAANEAIGYALTANSTYWLKKLA